MRQLPSQDIGTVSKGAGEYARDQQEADGRRKRHQEEVGRIGGERSENDRTPAETIGERAHDRRHEELHRRIDERQPPAPARSVRKIFARHFHDELRHHRHDDAEADHVDQHRYVNEDNGIGFNSKEVREGMGLKNIQNRTANLDGELTIDSTPGKGSSFIIEIPHL